MSPRPRLLFAEAAPHPNPRKSGERERDSCESFTKERILCSSSPLPALLRVGAARSAAPGEGQGGAGQQRKNHPTCTTSPHHQTDAETVLWQRIRNRQIDGRKFARQVIGRYICDFVCREKQVVIEVDGGQHNESAEDAVRDRYLVAEGYRVLRFWNNEVLGNLEGVLTTIQSEIRG